MTEMIRIKLKVTKAQAKRMTRVARWEKASADTCLVLSAAPRPIQAGEGK